MEWLNTYTLIGFTEKRGNAWHYRAADQGDEPNHYVGPVPVEDVRRRLLGWEAQEVPLYVPNDTHAFPTFVPVEGRKAIIRSDTRGVLGVFKDGYAPHQYDEWLVRNVESILDDQVSIGQAGLLKNGAQAWVSVELPDNVVTDSGIEVRPQLLATTSFDGSTATTYKLTSTIVVCDNTREIALSGKGARFRLKHTRYSTLKLGEARNALGLLYDTRDAVSQEIEALIETEVTREQFNKLVDTLVPIPTENAGKTSRPVTIALNKQDAIRGLYANDPRVAPWAGTAFGVAQAFSTFNQHEGTIRGTSRALRNAGNALENTVRDQDKAVIDALELVLAAA